MMAVTKKGPVLGLILCAAAAVGLAGCGSDNSTNDSGSTASATVSVNYTVTSDEYLHNIKRTVEVALPQRISEAELTALAQAIKNQATRATERTFIGYRVDGDTAGMYWATTHYNPNLEVRILGMSAEEAEQAKARPIPKFATAAELFADTGEFDEESGSFRLVSEDPLHIHLSPSVVAGDSADVVESELQRAVIYGVFKTLIHTDAQQVRVSSTPLLKTSASAAPAPQDSPRIEINITQAKALQAVQKFLPVDDLQNLVAHERHGWVTWTSDFERIYYEDNDPGLKAFFVELMALASQ